MMTIISSSISAYTLPLAATAPTAAPVAAPSPAPAAATADTDNTPAPAAQDNTPAVATDDNANDNAPALYTALANASTSNIRGGNLNTTA